MKSFFKWGILTVLSLIAIALIWALFIKKDYAVERSISIRKNKQEVYDFVKFLKNQDLYSPWAKIDTSMKKSFVGTDAQIGFVSAWESSNDEVGTGRQTIIAINDERIDYRLEFLKPFESQALAYMIVKPSEDSTTNVTWGFNSTMPYPSNLMMAFIDFEEMIGKDYEKGLIRLKTLLEK
jgi:hypothetical protein